MDKNTEHTKSNVSKTRVISKVIKQRKLIPWSNEEVQKVMAVAREEGQEAWVTFAILTGVRKVELIRLTWEDVDFEKQTVRIHSRVTERVIQLDDVLVHKLKTHHEAIQHLNTDLVFPNKNGNSLSAAVINGRLQRLIQKAGVPPIQFYELRFLHGQRLLQIGASLQFVKDRLGHSTIDTTFNLFSHVLTNEKKFIKE